MVFVTDQMLMLLHRCHQGKREDGDRQVPAGVVVARLLGGGNVKFLGWLAGA